MVKICLEEFVGEFRECEEKEGPLSPLYMISDVTQGTNI